MAKMHFMKFFPADFLVDTQCLTMQEKGMWITLICNIWIKSKTGTLEMDSTQLCALIGTREDDIKAFRHLMSTGVGNIEEIPISDTKPHRFLVHSRRIERDRKGLEVNAFYQSKHRSKGKVREMSGKCKGQKLEAKKLEAIKDNNNSFEKFWKSYPKKVGKGAAEKAWEHVVKGRDENAAFLESVVKAVSLQKGSAQWQKEGGQFIPNPATWLNQRRWEDEAAPLKTAENSGSAVLT